jgi:hypothetical protein
MALKYETGDATTSDYSSFAKTAGLYSKALNQGVSITVVTISSLEPCLMAGSALQVRSGDKNFYSYHGWRFFFGPCSHSCR